MDKVLSDLILESAEEGKIYIADFRDDYFDLKLTELQFLRKFVARGLALEELGYSLDGGLADG